MPVRGILRQNIHDDYTQSYAKKKPPKWGNFSGEGFQNKRAPERPPAPFFLVYWRLSLGFFWKETPATWTLTWLTSIPLVLVTAVITTSCTLRATSGMT